MINTTKGVDMSRLSKFLLLIVLIVFVLACNFVIQPIDDVQNLAGTAESIASAFPIETLQALPSALPLETIQAGIPTANPQGTPLSEWNEIPIMSQATAGQEFNEGLVYSFKVNTSTQEVQDYYNNELANRGWSPTISLPGDENVAIMLFSKDSSFLTITVTFSDGESLVVLTLG
jgi:hypothetical protein